MPEKTSYEISWGSLWKVLAFVALVWVLYTALDVLLAILVSLVIAAGLDAPVTWLQKKGVPRLLGTLLFFVLGVIFVAVIIYAIVPIALVDFSQLTSSIREYIGPVFDFLGDSENVGTVSQQLNTFTDALISGNVSLTQVVSSLFGGVFLVITVLILAFYLTVGQDGVERFLVAILPTSYEETAVDLYLRTRRKIGKWLKGQVLLSLVVGLATFLGLWALGVKYSLLLGILAGLFEIVPFVGPIFSGGIAVLVALSTSFNLALHTFILFIVIQQLENNLLVPGVMRLTTSLNAAVVLISILIGGTVFGFVGLILAIPISVFIQEVLERWTTLKQKRRGLGLK